MDPDREAQKHVDPVDPDPEHCLLEFKNSTQRFLVP
jgi:hypothetical protein